MPDLDFQAPVPAQVIDKGIPTAGLLAQVLVADVDLIGATLTVRQTKFHKSRCLPLHASVVHALSAYRQVRDRYADPGASAAFFVSRVGGTPNWPRW